MYGRTMTSGSKDSSKACGTLNVSVSAPQQIRSQSSSCGISFKGGSDRGQNEQRVAGKLSCGRQGERSGERAGWSGASDLSIEQTHRKDGRKLEPNLDAPRRFRCVEVQRCRASGGGVTDRPAARHETLSITYYGTVALHSARPWIHPFGCA